MEKSRAGNQYKLGGKKGQRFTPAQRRILLKRYEELERRMKPGQRLGQREIETKLADEYACDERTIQRNLKRARQEKEEKLEAEKALEKGANDLKRDLALRILPPSVKLFNDGAFVAMYATVEVATVSKVVARDCWAWVEVLPSGGRLPLHWGGTLVTPEEASAPRITIRPEKPALLDVAVALPPAGKMPRPSGSFRAEVTGIVGYPSWDGAGCWLAQPAALYNPSPLSEAYLKAGEYRISVRVGCEGGEGDTCDYVLKSPTSWEGLQLVQT